MADLTFADVRAKYPQYSDLTDDQLADALHRKYYADLPKDQFYGKIGFTSKPPEDTGGFPAANFDQTTGTGVTPGAGADSLAAAMMPLQVPTPKDSALKRAPSGAPLPVTDPAVARIARPGDLAAPVTGRPETVPVVSRRSDTGKRIESYPPSRAPGRPGAYDTVPEGTTLSDMQLEGLRANSDTNTLFDAIAPVAPAAVASPTPATLGRDTPDLTVQKVAPPPIIGNARALDKRLHPDPDGLEAALAPDPFAGEGAGALLKRRGQQFVEGGLGMVGSYVQDQYVKFANLKQNFQREVAPVELQRSMDDAEKASAILESGVSPTTGKPLAPDEAAIYGQYLEEANAAIEALTKTINTPVKPASEWPQYQSAGEIAHAAEGVIGRSDPRDDSFWAKAASGVGSSVPFIAAAIMSRGASLPVTAQLGADVNQAQVYDDARRNGASEEDAQAAGLIGAAIGTTEALPIEAALKWVPPQVRKVVSGRLAVVLGNAFASGGEEAVQEAVSQIANNLVAQGYYDPERGVMNDVAVNAVIGAISGGALGGGMGLVSGGEDDVGKAPAPPAGGQAPGSGPLSGDGPAPPPGGDVTALPPEAGKPGPVAGSADAGPAQPQGQAPGEVNPLAAALTPEAPAPKAEKPKPLALTADQKVKPEPDKSSGPRYEDMPELEGQGDAARPTGRTVRVNLDTGEAEVISEESSGAVADAGTGGVGTAGGEPQPVREAEVIPPPSPAAAPEPVADPEGRPGPQRRFLTHDETLRIVTDPKTFQYKGGADAEGVTDTLRNVTRFDPNRAGQVVLFERKDGTLVVADGHQRTGLARRMADAGQDDVSGMAAVIYREADGYTADEVMTEAALKNIGEGSGTATDAARVLRTMKGATVADLGLPPNSALVRKADGLRRLSDQAWGMVVNGVASEDHGDVVGRIVKDEALQADILALLTRESPSNRTQAEMIARMASEDASTETQTDMFGTEQVAKSLYVERAKVLDHAMKNLGSQLKTFKNLVDNQGAIEGAGNTLDAEANAAMVDDAGKVRQYLTSQANMKGPISDALRKAAEAVRSGTPVAAAAKGFLRDAKAALAGGGPAGQASAGGGSADAQGQAGQAPAVEPDTYVAPQGDDLFAALLPPEKPKTDGKAKRSPQDDLLAALQPAPQGKTPAQQRSEAEAKVKASQSKKGTTAPQDAAGPLFDDQSDIEGKTGRSPGETLSDAADAAIAPYEAKHGTKLSYGNDLRGTNAHRELLAELAKVDGLEARKTIADDFVRRWGKKKEIEFLIGLTSDGLPVAVTSGKAKNATASNAFWAMAQEGRIAFVTHNHPSGSALSFIDMTMASLGIEQVNATVGDGGVHTLRVRGLPKIDYSNLALALVRKEKLIDTLEGMPTEAFATAQKVFDGTNYNQVRADRVKQAVNNLALHDLGVIDYEGPAREQLKAEGIDFDEYFRDKRDSVSEYLRRAGFVLSERGDRSGDSADQPADAGGGKSQGSAAGAAGTVSADAGGSETAGKPLDDFDAAATDVLDDVFGKDEAQPARTAPRPDADIAKDLGGLFGEGGSAFGMAEDALDQSTYDKAIPLFREALAGQNVATQSVADTIRAVAVRMKGAGMTRDGVMRMLPYLKAYLLDVKSGKLTGPKEASDVSGTGAGLEPDRGDATAGDGVGATGVPAAGGPDGSGSGTGGGAPDAGNGGQPGGGGVPAGRAAALGTEGNQGLPGRSGAAGQPAAGGDGAGSGDAGQSGVPDDYGPAKATGTTAVSPADVGDRRARQDAADRIAKAKGVRPADEANIRETLPLLLPAQQDDVLKIERRFAKPDGHGMLLTNGTGTGKTYSGGGVIKRFVQAGKSNILIVAPSQGILDHWVEAGADLGVTVSKIGDTSTAGQGVVATTYANLGANMALAGREWDLVIADEAHTLMRSADAKVTDALGNLRAVTHRPSDLAQKSRMNRAAEWAKAEAMKDGEAKTAEMHRLFEAQKKDVERLSVRPRSKVLFMSATPFAYDVNVDYAEGYLFDYPEDGRVGHSRQPVRNLFMVENFGYRIRYHKLTKPESAVDGGVFERQFHEKLKRQGVLSGRSLDIEADYDRRFVKRADAQGGQIDAVLDFVNQKAGSDGPEAENFRAYRQAIRKSFDYLARMRLLEAIKARLAQPDIDAHLALGRKVVVFHDFNRGGGFNPFTPRNADEKVSAGYAALLAAKPEVADLNFTGYGHPIGELTKRYGDRAVVYNGDVPQKARQKAKKDFNADGSGVDLIIVNSAAGESGISLHDTTGKHQRVLINLGMPVRPTTALQEEGRIRREGNVSDAPFRYYTIGTTWERQAFAKKIAERSGTVENLALGDEARTIRDSFIDAYQDADEFTPGHEGEGRGGKEKDRARALASPYEQAKAHYYGRMKTTGSRVQRDGIDFYPTPEPLAFKMVEWAGIRAYERALEPSAGDGSIARYLPEHADRTIVEPSADLRSRAALRAVGARSVGTTFENFNIVNKFHAIVMNPPFGSGGKTAFEHVAKAMKHLKPGGRIVALVPTGPMADKRWEAIYHDDAAFKGFRLTAEVELPAVTFEKAGTSIRSHILIIDRTSDDADQSRRINMTGSEDIKTFFDRLEGISVPDRPAQTVDPVDDADLPVDEDGEPLTSAYMPAPGPQPVGAPLAAEGDFKLAETKHSKTGQDLFVATRAARVGDTEFRAMRAVAKTHGGWYSLFRGKDAIPGFQFKTAEARQRFLDDMQKPTIGFAEDEARFQRRNPALEAGLAQSSDIIAAAMPALRKELDRLGLKRVNLWQKRGVDWQGMFLSFGVTDMHIIIGASMDPMATLYHEVIHALRTLNLFSPVEWRALEIKAAKTWVAQYDIVERYPGLDPAQQIEEAIAEAFADYAAGKPVSGSILVRAFAKIARLLKAIRDVMAGRGLTTPEQVFGKALAGEIGGRANARHAQALAMAARMQEPDHVSPAVRAEINGLRERLAPAEDYFAIPEVAEIADDLLSRPPTTSLPGYGTPEFFAARRYVDEDGSEIAGADAAVARLTERARVMGWVDDKMIPPADSVKNDRKAVILIGAPAAGKSSIANPWARDLSAAIIDADDAKKIIPEFDRGRGTQAVHEESSRLGLRVKERLMREGANLVLPKVGARPHGIRDLIAELKAAGYEIKLVLVDTPERMAWARMFGRYLSSGRIIARHIMQEGIDGPVSTFHVLEKEGVADSYVDIDNSAEKGAPLKIRSGRTHVPVSVRGGVRGDGGTGGDRSQSGRGPLAEGTGQEGLSDPTQSPAFKRWFGDSKFDPADPRIRYQAARIPSRQARANMATAMGGSHTYLPDRRVWEELTRAGAPIWSRIGQAGGAISDRIDRARLYIQDKMLPVLRAQNAIERSIGAPLSEDQNVYIKEETFSGKVGRHLFEIDEDYTKPIINLIAGTKGALTVEDVGEWLYARHAIERNKHIASINPRMPDGGSGMDTADAQAILAAAAAGPNAQVLRDIGVLIDKLRERTLRLRETSGLISATEAQVWRSQYKHYVPLKGFADSDHSEAVLDLTGIGKNMTVRGSESRRALGRSSEAFNPLQAAITQAQEVAIRAEKNAVGVAAYDLASSYPSKALWEVKKVQMKRYYNRSTGLVESRPVRPADTVLEPNEIALKKAGDEYRVVFHDPRIARSLGSIGADQMGVFMRAMSWASRIFSMTHTMLDPEFVIRNAFRDVTAAELNIRAFGEADRNAIAKAMLHDWRKAFAGTWRGIGNDESTQWAKYYKEFEKCGAKVSFWHLEQPEAADADLKKRVRLAGGSRLGPASRWVRLSTRDNPVLHFVERTNIAVDNAIRLAAFVAARNRGWTPQQAASLAKNMTVNFNRRGLWSANINALYPFANASVQGTATIFRALTSKRLAKYAVGMVALGVILDAVNAGLSNEDEDGELAYDKIPDYKNRTNLVVMLGPKSGNAVTIWMPYGWAIFPYVGQQIGKVRRGVKEPGRAMADVAAALMMNFSPIQGEDVQSLVTPTILDPIVEMAMNKDWLGRPIRPENAYADYGPDAYKYFAGASEISKQLADVANRATGGNRAESGLIDVSPEYIDHMFGFVTGGMGRFIGRSADIIAKSVEGNFDEIESRNIPVVRALGYETGDWLDRDRYYRFRDEIRQARASAKVYAEQNMRAPERIRRLNSLYDDMQEDEQEIEKYLRAARKKGGAPEGNPFIIFNRKFLRVMGPQGE